MDTEKKGDLSETTARLGTERLSKLLLRLELPRNSRARHSVPCPHRSSIYQLTVTNGHGLCDDG